MLTMIFMLLKIKMIAKIFNKIRFISLYSKFCEGGGGWKNLYPHLRGHMKAYRCVKRVGRGLKTVQKSIRTMCITPYKLVKSLIT